MKTLAALSAIVLAATVAQPVQAQDRYLGEIITVGYTFCPRGTYEANGQLLSIRENTALFSLFGTTYGGDGRTTFALPDLRGRVIVGQGQGPGRANVPQGAMPTGGASSNAESHAGGSRSDGVPQLALRFCVVAQGIYPSRN